MSRHYDWSRFRRLIEPGAVVAPIDPTEEPTKRIPVESMEQLTGRPRRLGDEELEAELAQHAGAGQ